MKCIQHICSAELLESLMPFLIQHFNCFNSNLYYEFEATWNNTPLAEVKWKLVYSFKKKKKSKTLSWYKLALAFISAGSSLSFLP